MERKKHSQDKIGCIRYNRRNILKLGACTGIGLVLGQACSSCSSKSSISQKDKLVSDEFAMVAYCGLECDKCEAYLATKNNNDQLRAKVAEEWKMKAEDIHCLGCKSEKALFNCEAKKCAKERNLPTCAHCDDFPSCDKEIWTKFPQLKEKIEKIRTTL